VKLVYLEEHSELSTVSSQVVTVLSKGELVILPTETQYGLCCDSRNIEALGRLNEAKRRSASEPVAVFIPDIESTRDLSDGFTRPVENFVSRFWPGPLTLVLESSTRDWPGIVTESGTIGLRCSSHPLIQRVVSSTDMLLTATSANPHDVKPSASVDDLKKWFSETVSLCVLDASVRDDAVPSTVVQIIGNKPRILRSGAITDASVFAAWEKEVDS